jgi:hypothetical protein
MEFATNPTRSERAGANGSPGFAPWEALVEPDRIFAHPQDVLAAPHLTREEKRAVLASWASDVWAVESAPGLRHCPGLPGHRVSLDAVLAALKTLDPDPPPAPRSRPAPRVRPIRWLPQGMPRLAR